MNPYFAVLRNSPSRNPLESPHLSFPPATNSSPSLVEPASILIGSNNSNVHDFSLTHASPRSFRDRKSPDFETHQDPPRAKGNVKKFS